ncbi:MAG: substrate-binding domain-containing protein [Vicinamibacterales bacterium]
MAVRIVRLGSPRVAGEGVRLGTRTGCRRPAGARMSSPLAVYARQRLSIFAGAFVVLLLVAAPKAALAADIAVYCSNGFRAVMQDLVPQFERSTNNTVKITYGLSTDLQRRIEGGDAFDLAILTPALIQTLAQQGRVVANSRATLARSPIGIATKHGSAALDFRTADGLTRALRSAKSIGYAKEGASAAFFLATVERLGLARELQSRIVAAASGAAVGASVAKGDLELGVLPVSEILPIAGIDVGGTFPGELAGFITMTAGVSTHATSAPAARVLIEFLSMPSSEAVLRTRGMERARQ